MCLPKKQLQSGIRNSSGQPYIESDDNMWIHIFKLTFRSWVLGREGWDSVQSSFHKLKSGGEASVCESKHALPRDEKCQRPQYTTLGGLHDGLDLWNAGH